MPTDLATATGRGSRKLWGRTGQVLREALRSFLAHNSLTIAASIAYHSLLAIFPLLLLLLGLGGIYIRRYELTGSLAVVLERYLPVTPDFIMQNLVGISRAYGKIGLISFLLLLWSSSGVFLPLEQALDRAWEVERGRPWWQSRLVALEMAAIVGTLLLVSAPLVGLETLFRNWLARSLGHSLRPLAVFVYHTVTATTSFAVALLAFVVLFQRLPNRPMRFGQVFPSALLTAMLWEGSRLLFNILLPFFNYRHVYGSIGVVVALMTWAYISSAVILFGAQVSRSLYGTLKVAAPTTGPALEPP